MDRTVSTPLSILQAESCDINNIETSKFFDGILALGKSLKIVSPYHKVNIKEILKIDVKTPKRFKGISFLEDYHKIFQIDIATVGLLNISLLLCSKGSPFHECTFANILSNIHAVLESVLDGIPESSRVLSQTSSKTRSVLPRDWILFAEMLKSKLAQTNESNQGVKCFPTDCDIFFSAQRMGQDLTVPTDNFMDFALPYKCLNMSEILSLAIHNGVDITHKDSESLFWNIYNVSLRLGKPYKKFNVMMLPGLGNMVYEFPGAPTGMSASKCKYLSLYTRCGHQLHRDENKYFKHPYIAERLCQLQGAIMVGAPIAITEKDEALFDGRIGNPVCALLEQVLLKNPLRCEIVWEQTMLFTIGVAFKVALTSTQNWINIFELKNPQFFQAVPGKPLQNYLSGILTPSLNTINLAVTDVDGGMDENIDIIERIRRLKRTTVDDYMKLYLAEGIITMALNGRLSKNWNVWLPRTLGFDKFDVLTRNPLDLTELQSYILQGIVMGEEIERFVMPTDAISKHIPTWMLQKTKVNEAFVNAFREGSDPDAIAHGFLILMMSTLGKLQDNSTAGLTNESITLCRTANKDHKNHFGLKYASEFFRNIVEGKLKILPSGIPTILLAMSKKFDVIPKLTQLLEEMLFTSKHPLFLNTYHGVVAVVPQNLPKHFVQIYTEAFCWWDGGRSEVGKNGTLCQTAIKDLQGVFPDVISQKYSAVNFMGVIKKLIDDDIEYQFHNSPVTEENLAEYLNPLNLN